jgi:hypothetical protein
MARLRVRFKFNPGRKGAPLDRLGEFTVQAEKFLRSLAHDLNLEAKKGEWIADNFHNASFDCDAEYGGDLTDSDRNHGITALDAIFGDDPLTACSSGMVTPLTVAEYAKIGEVLSPGDYFEAGIYKDDDAVEPPPLRQVTYKKTEEIKRLLRTPYISEGAVQGVTYNWAFGADPPFFNIRALQSSQLVRCEYEKELYQRVHDATAVENAVVMVYGTLHWDRLTDAIVRIRVSDIERTNSLSIAEFNRLFGSAPEFTGDMSTAEYIEWVRGDGQ